MIAFLKHANALANRHAGTLLLVGIVGVVWHNWRLWQQDKLLISKRVKARPLPSLEEWPFLPKVSVLVAAWNEAKHIDAHIRTFLTLRYPNRELIVCAGGIDGTYSLANRWAGSQVRVLKQHAGEGKQRALKRCFEESTGELIFLTDADCLFDDASFERTLIPIVWDGEDVVTGRFSPLLGQQGYPFVKMQWYVDNYARAHSPVQVDGLIGRNAALRRSVLVQSGGFDADVPIGTDYYLARRLAEQGKIIRYAHDSVISTEYTHTFFPYLRQQSRWLRNILIHGKKFQAHHHFRDVQLQCLIGVFMVILPLTFPILRTIGFIPWFLGFLHGVSSRLRYVRFGEITLGQPRQWRLYIFVPFFLFLDQVMLVYTLIEWMSPRVRLRW